MSSRNPTVSSSSTFTKKIKKPSPVITETAMLISEAPDFLRSLNIMRAPIKSAEFALPCNKTETEEIIAAMKETLMASPAPTPVILPKKRKRPTYDFKQLAEKIAKHNHNEILDPKVEEVNGNTEDSTPVLVVANNKGKKLMKQIEVGLIKQDRLRRKRGIPSKVPKNVEVPPKKAKIEIQDKNIKNVETPHVKKPKVPAKKKTKIPEKKIIDENFTSKIQTRNRKKNFIEESLSNESPPEKDDKLKNNNESSISYVDLESSQEVSASEVPQNEKTVKINPFKPKDKKYKKRRKPGVFFGSRKKKRNWRTINKNQQPTSSKMDKITPKLEYSNSNKLNSKQNEEPVLQNNEIGINIKDIKTEFIVQESLKPAQIEPKTNVEENKVTAPISTDILETREPEEVAEPRWHSQTDAFFDLPSTISLGSILSSVNQAS